MNDETTIPHPQIGNRDAWLDARRALLEREKALTRQKDALSAARRRLPMVRLDKEYVFEGPVGKARLIDLFEGRRQLIVYHFMFDPNAETGCMGCTGFVDEVCGLSRLAERDATFVLVSRAAQEKLAAYRRLRGWTIPWYSSLGTDFNCDFHVTLGPAGGSVEYNYRTIETVSGGEAPGLSVFFRLDDTVYHTYSTYARGVESLTSSDSLLDVTPYGRQEDWEDSPEGWPQRPTYG